MNNVTVDIEIMTNFKNVIASHFSLNLMIQLYSKHPNDSSNLNFDIVIQSLSQGFSFAYLVFPEFCVHFLGCATKIYVLTLILNRACRSVQIGMGVLVFLFVVKSPLPPVTVLSPAYLQGRSFSSLS
jgi:hypothetical protein